MADAIGVNTVRYERSDFQASYDHPHLFTQTLQTLNLTGSSVGVDGAKYLAAALRVNQVA